MRWLVVTATSAWVSGACTPTTPPTSAGSAQPGAGTEPAVEASGSGAPVLRQAEPVPAGTMLNADEMPGARATGPIRSRLMRWATRGASQTEFAEIFRDVLVDGRKRDVEAALYELARMLSTWRMELEPELVAEVGAFAGYDKRGLWERIDARYIPPVLEILLDQQDAAAVLRLTAFYQGGPVDRSLNGARAAATSLAQRTASVTLTEPPPCRVRGDGEFLGSPPWDLAPGTHYLSCDGNPIGPVTLRVQAGQRVTLAPDLLPQ